MAFGLDDLRNWIEGLRKTFNNDQPSNFSSVGNDAIQAGIVNPLKIASDFTGVSQGYKAVQPNASNLDRGLGLLALAGMLGGSEAANFANKLTSPKYVYGVHISPTPGLSEIKASPEMARWTDSIPGHNYFFDISTIDKRKLSEMEKYLGYHIKNRSGVPGVSIYNIRTPIKGVQWDSNINRLISGKSLKPEFPKSAKKGIPIWENSGKNKNYDMPSISDFLPQDRGARSTKNPLEVLKETRVRKNYPDVPGEDPSIRPADMWNRADFLEALRQANKRQPILNRSRHNTGWLKYQEKENQKWWDLLHQEIKDEFRIQKRLDLNNKIKNTPIYKKRK